MIDDHPEEPAHEVWDSMDVDSVRAVAWLAIPEIVNDIVRSFGDGSGFVSNVSRSLTERGKSTGLNGAALVCGDMESERDFFEAPPTVGFRKVHGFDLSQTSLARFVPRGIEWEPHHTDCNDLVLDPDSFDLIVASHGAHHVSTLDNLFRQASRSLNDGGILYMYEWIGPPFLRIPRRNRLVASLVLLTLFPGRTTRTTHMNKVKGFRWMLDAADPNVDPSEACNSLQLLPSYRKHFDSVHEYLHGSLSYPMFEGIAQNFDLARPWVRRRLSWAVRVDRFLTRIRLVHPLFIVAIGTPSSRP